MMSPRLLKFIFTLSVLIALMTAPLYLKGGGLSTMSIFKFVNKAKEKVTEQINGGANYAGYSRTASKSDYEKLSSHVYLRGQMVPRNPRGVYVIDGETIFYQDDKAALPALRDSNLEKMSEDSKKETVISEANQDWKNFDNPADLIKAAKDIQKASKDRAKMLESISKSR